MIRKILRLAAVTALLSLLAGCWDIKTIQDMNYFTALGIDFKDGRYIVYAQMLDFSSVAKQEGAKMSGSPSIWSGHEEGISVGDATAKLYKTSQQRVFWGHVTSIVMTENALRQGIIPNLDSLLRYNETRYIQWVYATREPIDRLFTVEPFFSLSPLASILAQPLENFQQFSYIRPIRLNRAFVRLREPGYTLLLPSLSINTTTWKKNNEPDPKLAVNGVYAIGSGNTVKWFGEDKLPGLRWLEEKTNRTMFMLYEEGEAAAKITAEKPQAKIIPHAGGDSPSFTIRLQCRAFLSEQLRPMKESTIEKKAAGAIRSEIERTFAEGKKSSVDLYSLEHRLYRDAFPLWSKLTQNGAAPLSDYSLDRIDIDVKLIHSGMYKENKQQQQQY
ncbi:Ger(x)C family spore germination protein [Paenibacillus hamazuiensis]|uniref:Ger(x)C family spore germination protein n=1 Tax=Paenibacillus hamazuiensis TaxID=2936508 RepID=UPI00200C3146|nr:Ger(x)C family spore germination protein [Paenibacillus hamazuiensis]